MAFSGDQSWVFFGGSRNHVKEWPQIEFFSLPVEEKLKMYSDDPSKTETFYNWRSYLRLFCYPSDMYVPEWPSSLISRTQIVLDPNNNICRAWVEGLNTSKVNYG